MSTINSFNSNSIGYLKARQAYKNAVEAHKSAKSVAGEDGVYKAGSAVEESSSIDKVQSAGRSSGAVNAERVVSLGRNVSFDKIVDNKNFAAVFAKAATDRIKKVKRAEEQTASAILGNADAVEVMASVAESEMALKELVAVKDKIIGFYQEIFKMSL